MGIFNKFNKKNSIKSKDSIKTKAMLLNSTNELDRNKYFTMGFPLGMEQTVNELIEYLPNLTKYDVWNAENSKRNTYLLGGQIISFPDRIYFDEIEEDVFSNMSDIEKMIINCIYSRSCNGFVREKHIRNLLLIEYPEWSIPYIVKICDEYIIDILQLVYENLKDKNTNAIKEFCDNNYISFCKSYNRMISYWNEYYRWDCYRYKNYVGRKLFIECFGASRKINCLKLIKKSE